MNDIFPTGYTTHGTKNETGTGLGLALCQDFLGLLGSKLEVISTTGKGTTFYFDLRK